MKIDIIGLETLKKAYQKQVELSNKGTIGKKVSKGAGGDYSLKGDIESEQEVIKILKENNFPAIIYAEEHGLVKLCEIPEYSIDIDGFDGSSDLARNVKARGGTIVAIYPNLKPKYKDAIFAGITDFSTNRIIYAIKGEGTFLCTYENKNWKIDKIKKFQIKHFSPEIKMHFDDPKYWGNYEEGITAGVDEISKVTRNFFTNKLEKIVTPSGLVSSGAMCVDLVVGKVDAVAGVSAKGVFEPPAEYLILKELGGTIVNCKGNDIGNNYWLKDRVLHKNNPIPLLRASSHLLAFEIIEYLNS